MEDKEAAKGKRTVTTGTLTGPVTTNFIPDQIKVELRNLYGLSITADQLNVPGPIEKLYMAFEPDIPSGEYDYLESREFTQLAIYAKNYNPYYLVSQGTVNIEFDHSQERYKGFLKMSAYYSVDEDTTETITLECEFDLNGITDQRK